MFGEYCLSVKIFIFFILEYILINCICDMDKKNDKGLLWWIWGSEVKWIKEKIDMGDGCIDLKYV